MEKIVNPTKARSNLYALIKMTNQDSHPVIIAGADEERSAVLMSKKDYDAMQETMSLIMNGQLQDAIARQNDKNDEEVDLDQMIREIDNEK
ncbi:type II toxin-antitoxin system Phd/YefM family antitoxin [Lactobacillus sp. LC28-10]|uniref:Antitoxin n=1 Tax=Secundilactobacillus angelensis TaxID=2722706 RepID=A0ABX1KXI6_9LACO|nr:type II toxin-antitoxin system Phd/YefM family antitoxin [Secundilactobacillus angelensis]MCH5461792.1 type II toxin-antitoxin system Phd/YefM family antitoxin [Secundilactobacillus angelensis]NLR18631.1 type II toxin-antitoxin system Phd/YefM family antitoxin [Secundilactobacillus angelensis]